ncbi:nucleotidyltransferase family protein [Aquihabitans sp. McL0605]|uniref:nucleotidyltransferase family protein n=1 Tax=Aquihabitans sp. McL0605 TaxID=3415671 RepID=UPI003CFAFDC2
MRRPGLDGSCWPGPVTEEVLRAALLPPDEARAAWTRVRGDIDLRDDAMADRSRLLPLVLHTIGAEAAGDDAPTMKRLHREAFRDNTLHLHHAPSWLDPLQQGRVAVMLLKGLPLALHAYPDLGRRPMSDVDVLVPSPDIARAVDLLVRDGWVCGEANPLPRSWRARHSVPLVHPEGGHIDLHHVPGVPFMGRTEGRASVPEIWAGQRPSELVGRAIALPAPEDLLLNVIVHGVTSIPGWSSRWVADAVVLLRTQSVDWDRLVEHARRHRVVLPVRSALRYLVDEFDAPVPADALWALWAAVASAGDRRRFDLLTGPADDGPMGIGAIRRARWVRLRTAVGPGRAVLATPRFTADLLRVDRTRHVPAAVVRRGRRWAGSRLTPSRTSP